MRRRTVGLGLAAVIAAPGLAAAPAGADGIGGDTTTTAVVYRVEVRADGQIVRTQTEVPVTIRDTPGGSKPAAPAPAPAARLDPSLAAAVREAPAGSRQQVVVTFQEDVKIPRFPDFDPAQPRTAAANVAARARADALTSGIQAQRQPGYQAISADLARWGARTVETFWLTKAIVVDAPLAELPALAARADVTHVQPVRTATPPPADSDPSNDEVFARFFMNTDGYFNLGQTSGFVGILDSGVRPTHTMFNNPSKAWIREDLTTTVNPNPDDTCGNHGTSTAAIITGNANLGNSLRGITGITVDSFKVYDCTGTPARAGLNRAAAMRGFQRAVQVGDRVIVAEMQASGEDETGGIATAADGAFDAGAVVIAANGNNGRNADGTPAPGSVNSPAVAQKVLGIGSVDVATGTTPPSQSLGPAPDGRTKPDVQAPTGYETASNEGDTSTRVFTGTSAATAQAAGAAALVRNFLRGGNGNIDPASVYAFLLASGNSNNGSSTVPPVNNTSGAGAIRLPVTPATFSTASQGIANGETVSLPLVIGQNRDQLNVAIWWPERPQTHDDIDLTVLDPSGVVRGASLSVSGVFERVNIVGPVIAGNWRIQVRGFNVPSGTNRVHMVAIAR